MCFSFSLALYRGYKKEQGDFMPATIETIISGLSHEEKLTAMDLLWRDLSRDHARYISPDWHRRIISERLSNPAPGERMPLEKAKADVKKRLNARRT